MSSVQTVSPRVGLQRTVALVIAALASLGLLGCRVTLLFDQPEAGADAPIADRPCATDQRCSIALPYCDRTTGRCVGCLTTADCSESQLCDPDSSRCRAPAL